MPELPEVETVRRDVHAEFAGLVVEDVRATGVRTLRRHGRPGELVERARGHKLVGTGRRGKYLLLGLDSGDVVVVHLGMSGQLLRAQAGQAQVRHTHVVFGFEGGVELRFVDPRTFGEVFVAGPAGVDMELDELAHLGIDPLGGPGTEARFAGLLAGRGTRLKPLLMDQTRVAGIGNMYADEILFEAGLRFDRPAGSLTGGEVRRLFRAMTATLNRAIEHRGSSLADEQYRDLYGRVGDFQRLHRVYAREGAACPRCATPIARVKAGGRSNFFCPGCQR
ncbi:MAG TPA: bifunctional DNA-formamidopyrimidine glycosylase/DNA-(apurinic or apyrimidinic site) lyase [Acidimicrobiales bacterium]|nr:bifunctional DNA-formamidopyrimidine glycosylase/DNA-(apurinic or apyrimidinic site) lyase [Acidimicrobiales bacterium]